MTVEQQLQDLTRKVDKISEALLGNEFNQHGGLVTIINDHEKRIEKIEESNVLTHEARIKALEETGITHKVYVRILIFIAAVITTGVIGLLLKK
ncbi:MAG: hypothetical protein MUF68_06780 [Cyclobacteriaceae bacterium]|jgi:hypothetical protein|nr:hypothetical protein [Cyclobacteriaceae bacterium]